MSGIKTKARMAGLFSLLTILGGGFAQGYVSNRLVVPGDAGATAGNILAHPGLLRVGFAVYMVEMACQIVATALFYGLFRPVNRSVNLATTFLGLCGCTIKAFSRVFFLAPLLVLGGGVAFLSAFSPAQLQAISMLLLDINDRGAAMALIFFGFATPLRGYLMFRSTFLPRILGVLVMVSGPGWLLYLYPPLGDRLFPLIAGIGLLASAVVIFWLLVFGVDEAKWRERNARNAA